MTDVYLRHLDQAEGVKVGEIPFSNGAFDEAIRLVKAWSVYVDDSDYQEFNVAQFRLSEGRAYFEIVVGEDA